MKIIYNQEYKDNIYNWTLVRDCVAGESAVKRKSTMYLPMPSGMENLKTGVSYITQPTAINSRSRWFDLYNPNMHPNPAYRAYLHRAHLPGMTDHTLRGLLGIATRKHPSISLPDELKYLIDEATPADWSLLTLFRELLSEVLQTGRVGLSLDIDDGKFKFVRYKAEDIANWEYHNELEAVMLVEQIKEGLFSDEFKESARVIRTVHLSELEDLDEDMTEYSVEDEVVVVETYDEQGNFVDVAVPTYMGLPISEMPFKIIGALTNEPNCDPAPLLPVALTAIQIYMKNADLSQAEYLTSNPTLILSGVAPDEAPVTLGSTVALAMSDPMAKAYYTETDSAGMQHLLDHIEKLSAEASKHGASLIADQKGEKESGEALQIRQAASTATLHSVVNTVGDAIESLLKFAAKWAGLDPSTVSFKPNTEFSEGSLTAQQVKSVVEAYLNKTISLETLIDNFRKAGLLQSGETTADELKRLQSAAEIMSQQPSDVVNPTTAFESSNKTKMQDGDKVTSGKD